MVVVVVKSTTHRSINLGLFDNRLAILVKLVPPVISVNPVFKRGVFEEEEIEEFVPCKAAFLRTGGSVHLVVQLTLARNGERIHEFRVLGKL